MEISRRNFLAFPLVAALPKFSGSQPDTEPEYPHAGDILTYADRPLSDHVTVWLGEEDVTKQCEMVSLLSGMAILMRHNDEGRPYILSGQIARDIVYGKFRVELKPGAPTKAVAMYRRWLSTGKRRA